MGKCVATTKGKNVCRAETPPGYKFCDEHKTRPKAIQEREEKTLSTVIDATDVFASDNKNEAADDKVGKEVAREQGATHKEVNTPIDQQSIYDKTTSALHRVIAHEEWTGELVATLSPDELRYQDNAGAEQLHSYLAMHERAMDRVLRAVTAVAKLDIDANAVNANKMLRQMVKVCVTNTLTRMGMAPHEIEQARQILAEEFEKAAGVAS